MLIAWHTTRRCRVQREGLEPRPTTLSIAMGSIRPREDCDALRYRCGVCKVEMEVRRRATWFKLGDGETALSCHQDLGKTLKTVGDWESANAARTA